MRRRCAFCPAREEAPDVSAGAVISRLSRDDEADRSYLQLRLQILLLPGKGKALPRQVELADAGERARAVRAGVHRGAGRAGGVLRVAGGGADADGGRFL